MNASFSMRNHSFVRISSGIVLLCMSLGMVGSAQAQFATTATPAVPGLATPPVNLTPLPVAPATAAAVPTRAPRPVDSIVVVVNNEVITRQELAERLVQVEKRLTAQGVALPPRAQLERQLLDRMIIERAQTQMAKENGVLVDDT